jgi:hyperosmotically inducible periplasmic protein
MNIKIATTCLIIGAMLGPVASFAEDSDSDRANPVAFVKDSVITTKIKAELAADQLTSLAHISVDTDSNGDVLLSGTAKTQEQADKAVSIARATEHVTSVKSQIKVDKDS